MNIFNFILSSMLVATASRAATPVNVHGFEVETITGEKISMQQFAGKVLVIVNTASRCGFTRQYAELVQLQKDFQDKGVVVIGFPSGNFGGQELGSNEEIAQFCEINFGVDFPLMAKSDVKGRNQHPLFAHLTSVENQDFSGDIRWNFEKFLVDRSGVMQRRFRSRTAPGSAEFRKALEQLLQPD
jgi:glutathione peroxidase